MFFTLVNRCICDQLVWRHPNIGSFHVKTVTVQKSSPLTISDFAETSSKWFLMNDEDLQNFSFGSFLVQKLCPPKFCTPGGTIFLHFCPILSPHIFEVTQIVQTWNLCKHFSFNFRYGFAFLILCLNFELQTFKNARFFKTYFFTLFFRGYILHHNYYSLIKLALLLKYIHEIVMKQYATDFGQL